MNSCDIDINYNGFIIINNDDDNFKDEFIIVDNIKNKNLNMINLNIIKQNFFLPIDKIFLFNYLKNSYINDCAIFKQFIMDVPRGKYYINNILFKSPYDIKFYLDYRFDRDIINKIMLCCTQSILAYPCELIQNGIQLNKYIGEFSQKKKNRNPIYVNINIDDNDIIIKIRKRLRIFELDSNYNDKTITKVLFKLEINIIREYFALFNIILKKNI